MLLAIILAGFIGSLAADEILSWVGWFLE